LHASCMALCETLLMELTYGAHKVVGDVGHA
jgi:hypothetical protein